MYALTQKTAKPAVGFGGKYRIVEVLKQNRSAPVPVEKQVAILYATIHDYLVNVKVPDVAEYLSLIHISPAARLMKIAVRVQKMNA